jgi:hypothetical protein
MRLIIEDIQLLILTRKILYLHQMILNYLIKCYLKKRVDIPYKKKAKHSHSITQMIFKLIKLRVIIVINLIKKQLTLCRW